MLIQRNHRVYLVLDPDEAEAVELMLAKPPAMDGSPVARALDRLRDAMKRARDKGARFLTFPGNLPGRR